MASIMDIELARTFLEIMRAGSFVQAAERLHVTQTTVTARVRTLEESLGCQLFVRSRTGTRLTPDGERFVTYAAALVQTWDRAKADLRLPVGHTLRLSVGTETSLWNPLLIQWLLWMKEFHPDVALRTEVSDAEVLLQQLEQGTLDAVLVHRPNYYAGMNVEQLLEEKLVLVRSPAQSEPFLFINWGADFVDQYDATLPQPRHAALTFNLGPVALQYMLRVGGSGYFRTRVVEPYLENGVLEKVVDAPEFTYPVFLVFRSGASEALNIALAGFRALSAQDAGWNL